MTAYELAKAAGLSPAVVRCYLRGERTPKLATLEVILDYFGEKIQFIDK